MNETDGAGLCRQEDWQGVRKKSDDQFCIFRQIAWGATCERKALGSLEMCPIFRQSLKTIESVHRFLGCAAYCREGRSSCNAELEDESFSWSLHERVSEKRVGCD